MTAAAIKVEQLSKHYGAVEALAGIDFTVPRGSVCGLLGANGAGKTTTIAILLGLLTPSSGRVHILGEDFLAHRYRVLPRMNFSSPYVDLPQRLTIEENLDVYARLYGVRQRRQRLAELFESLDLQAFRRRAYATLSAGQKTRVALAKALVNEPDLLLLDEPTASLDPDTADRMRRYLKNYQAATGASILFASHNMAEVERICDQVLIMRAGRIVDRDAPAALIARHGRANLEEVFLDVVRNTGRHARSEEVSRHE
ncbi:ABC-2 type transport system ATP-binding protein [Methylohalomonas lacus]|uniref:ABC-2 type transport system ATP-binding protein n=1 Tax=Methylohalomonas lacus TaxID=398773 RepID=A0AAE3L4Z1_9GAMM|nr:ABC transporter ATP-binding protein [Methylohalomonas lacus]MCS3902412.1 ABC-2 type transport system ATP-binding protein [Methylohalomonas lacus]